MELLMKRKGIRDRGIGIGVMVPKLCLLIITLVSCSTLVQKGGEIIEGSAFTDIELASYRSRGKETKIELRELKLDGGKWAAEITSSRWPGLAIRGGMSSGSGKFELYEARILASHVHGWNEFVLDIAGAAVFNNPKKNGAVLYITGNIEPVQISSGSIRLKSNYLTGNTALTSLRNRRERILSLTEWMAEKIKSRAGNNGEKTIFPDRNDFEKYWKPYLFPEMVSKSKRPPEYSKENAEWNRADSIKWNCTYTKDMFPEVLWKYRNSGAMLRDWEEALIWIYTEYSWDYILSTFNDTQLDRIK